MKIPFKWEKIFGGAKSQTLRAKVIRGWLVSSCSVICEQFSECLVFVPDLKHEGEI